VQDVQNVQDLQTQPPCASLPRGPWAPRAIAALLLPALTNNQGNNKGDEPLMEPRPPRLNGFYRFPDAMLA
jgi:hypothetical protein